MALDDNEVWNRALGFGVETKSPGPGDIALSGMLIFHSVAMNGGFLHAAETRKPSAIDAARSGYRYFGWPEISDLILKAVELVQSGSDLEELESQFDEDYDKLIPNDSALMARLQSALLARPEDFAAT